MILSDVVYLMASYETSFRFFCLVFVPCIVLYVHERLTNALILLKVLFLQLYASISFGTIYAIFRDLTCAYWVIRTFWVIVDKTVQHEQGDINYTFIKLQV
jgi:hypothetical protein